MSAVTPNRLIQLSLTLFLLLCALPLAAAVIAPPDPPEVTAKGYLLMDFNSGEVIAEQNADERLDPASLTKLMSAYTVFRELKNGSIKLDDQVTISEKAWRTGGSRTFVEVGTRVPVEVLLHGMITQSGNDASVALAEHVAGSEQAFADLMNGHAQRLGMSGTHFVNAPGLPDENHYTTARDLAKVAAATVREFPDYYQWYSLKEYTYNGITQQNRNSLLWQDESVDGMKTGHTEAAGYCLVASAQREGMRLISVILGTESTKARTKATQALLGYGFRFYESHRIHPGGEALQNVRVWKGDREQLRIGLKQDLWVTIPRLQGKGLTNDMTLQPLIEAPVEAGQVLGEVRVQFSGQQIAAAPVIALDTVAEGGLLQVAKDSVLMLFE